MRGDGGNPESHSGADPDGSGVDDDHSIVSHPGRKRGDIDVGGQRQGAAGCDIEPGAVTWADRDPLGAVELPFAQRPFVVCALILDREQLAVTVVHPDRE